MKAVVIAQDASLHWVDVPDPICGPQDCLIRIEAAALNRADLLQRRGEYPPPPGSPPYMGLEVAGTIVAMGAEAAAQGNLAVGMPVCALLGGGGYAQYVSVHHSQVMPIPRGCTAVEAAALPEACATAYLNLFWEGNLQKGDTLLVQAGASGLASMVIPMARCYGARVLTTVRSQAAAMAIAPLRAHRVIVTAQEALPCALRQEQLEGHPVAVALDCLGGAQMGACLPYLQHGARWIMIAALAGAQTQIDLKTVYTRNIRIVGSTLRSRPQAVKAQLLAALVRDIWPLVESGHIRPTIHRVLPITAAEEAQAILQRGGHVGKVVLQVAQP